MEVILTSRQNTYIINIVIICGGNTNVTSKYYIIINNKRYSLYA